MSKLANLPSSISSFDVVTNDLQIYLPVLEKSTIVFDLQVSDAYVSKKGETNLEVLKIKNGYNQCFSNSACEANAENLAKMYEFIVVFISK